MTSIIQDCPYCGCISAAFTLIADTNSQADSKYWYSMARCGVCREIGLVKFLDILIHSLKTKVTAAPMEFGKGKVVEERFVVMEFHPEKMKANIPDDLPDNVRVSYTEAEAAFSQNLLTSAASCYRKAIERAVKSLHPDGKGMLNNRIRDLEKKGLLPKTLIDLLDKVRILGNNSIHDDDLDPTLEDCTIARHFANLFLVYTFSLPAKVSRFSQEIVS
ncbi:MAG TPA: DUF4145 domain-containing protein [Tabrizicola sp.]|nr:DUF4145 domain-containing protein [Tabrizicola sp.]